MAEMMGALVGKFPCYWTALLHAPVAQQTVCNKLWLFVCLAGNSRPSQLNSSHPCERDWRADIPRRTLI